MWKTECCIVNTFADAPNTQEELRGRGFKDMVVEQNHQESSWVSFTISYSRRVCVEFSDFMCSYDILALNSRWSRPKYMSFSKKEIKTKF